MTTQSTRQVSIHETPVAELSIEYELDAERLFFAVTGTVPPHYTQRIIEAIVQNEPGDFFWRHYCFYYLVKGGGSGSIVFQIPVRDNHGQPKVGHSREVSIVVPDAAQKLLS